MPSITIGSEFFAKAKNDYNNWHWALVREFNQNGMDCGSQNIWWNVEETNGQTVVTVRNDGEPMSKEILIDKLLSLGSSGKEFDGVGGFGKAKEILYFCHASYTIHSGDLFVTGNGGSYEVAENGHVDGTESTIVIDGHHADEIRAQFNEFVFYGQWQGTFYYNGERSKAEMRKGAPRRDLGFATVYTNKSTEYRLVVRMNGQPMFVQDIGLDRCVVVELAGTSGDVMTANRDGLSWEYRSELSTFVTELSVDKRSALRARREKYRHYDGSRLCHRSVRAEDQVTSTSEILQIDEPNTDTIFELVQAGDEPVQVGTIEDREEHSGAPAQKAAAYRPAAPVEMVRVAIGEEFVIKNETDLVVPTYYRPDESDFSSYSKKLARIWGRLMLQLHRTFDHEAEFAIGFLFSDEDEAQFEDGQFGKVYYIAPAKLVEQSTTYSKSWKKAFALTERNRVLAIAVHEFVHGLGYDIHDERYASKLTDTMGKVMDNRKAFNWAWK